MEANLAGADLRGVALERANLAGARLLAPKAFGASFAGADPSRADLTGADLRSSNLDRVDLSGATLAGADLDRASLSGAELLDITWDGASGAAIAVFHARNIAHQMTGMSLERIAEDIGVDDYSRQVGPAVEHIRSAGVDISAPHTTAAPPPISWA